MADERAGVNEISGTVHGPAIQAQFINQLIVAPGPPPTGIPAQLPVAPSVFVGRDPVVRQIETALVDRATTGAGPDVVVIGGTGGIGKTALALRCGHAVRQRFPDGQVYVNLRGFDQAGDPADPSEVLRGFLAALGVPSGQMPVGLQERAALWRTLTSSRRLLVVLDNAVDSGQVEHLLPAGLAAATVVTSRHLLGDLLTRGALFIRLDRLGSEEAAELLLARLGCAGGDVPLPAVMSALLDSCAGLPLALCILAARARMYPLAQLGAFVDELGLERERLDAFSLGEPGSTLRSVFSWSYRRLSVPAQRAFRLLGLHTGPDLGLPALPWLIGSDVEESRRLAGELVRAHLLEEHRPQRYRLHDLLRLYSSALTQEVESVADRREALAGLLDYYSFAAALAGRLLLGEIPLVNSSVRPAVPESAVPAEIASALPDRARALAWFEAEDDSLLAAMAQARRYELTDRSHRLPLIVDNVWVWRGRLHDVMAMWEATLASAEQVGDAEALAHGTRFLGMACMRFGRNDEALGHLARSVACYGKLGDTLGQAAAQLNLAAASHRSGRLEVALDHATRSLALCRTHEYSSGEAHALRLLGGLHAASGDYRVGLETCNLSVEIFRRLGDEDGEADVLDEIGLIELGAGRYPEAAGHFRRAWSLYQKVGDGFGEADVLLDLARALLAMGEREEGGDVACRAAELFTLQGRHHKAQAVRDLHVQAAPS